MGGSCSAGDECAGSMCRAQVRNEYDHGTVIRFGDICGVRCVLPPPPPRPSLRPPHHPIVVSRAVRSVHRQEVLSASEAAKLCQQLAAATAACHRHNVHLLEPGVCVCGPVSVR